ncbi:MAG: serine/threonine-protein kinase [Actinomycetota bacterium]
MTATELAPGTVLDGYRIDEIAGRGGFSIVYRALDLATERPVAVKVLSDTDPSARRRLVREAQLLAGVRHPGVVPFRGLRQLDDIDVLVTDWVDGESLKDRLQRTGPLPVDEVKRLLQALAAPLDHLHRNEVVHRDISPSNVIIEPGGQPIVIDLGIGHHVDSRTLTRDDLLAGTPQYLAPEVIRGERADGRADQYSLGVIVHELLSGQRPFPAADKIATALHHQLHSVPIPLDEIDPSIPTELADAVLRSLQKDPALRFDTVADFAAAADAPTPPTPRTRRIDRRVSVLAVGAVAVLAIGGGAWAAISGTGDGGDETERAVATIDPSAEDPPVIRSEPLGSTADASAGEAGGEATTEDPALSQAEAPALGVAAAAVIDADRWPDGGAAALACNLLTGSDFATGTVPTDYFGDPPGRERVIEARGFQGSWTLEVGLVDEFGQYGEIIPVTPGESYLFAGWFDRSGPIAQAELGVTFLTPDYQPHSTGVRGAIVDDAAGFVEVGPVTVPSGVGFAVPYLFKDASPGVLLADELIFGRTEACRADIASTS